MTAKEREAREERREVERDLNRLPPEDVARVAPTVAQQWARMSIPEELQ